jgi:predicted PurR-regulated permease PerM
MESEGQFVRRVLIVAGIAALAALLWLLSEILLLVFASALLAVILRSVAACMSQSAAPTSVAGAKEDSTLHVVFKPRAQFSTTSGS